ncbi:hypothetical protein RDABS01_006005 [Bienertia sinuspersici]
MVCIREFHDKQRIYLAMIDKETDDPRHGTGLAVHRCLRRAKGIQPSIHEQIFLVRCPRRSNKKTRQQLMYSKTLFRSAQLEWTEDILFCFKEPLQLSSIYDPVYASFYSYAKDINIMRAFYESWCPTTNTLHTQLGELFILV